MKGSASWALGPGSWHDPALVGGLMSPEYWIAVSIGAVAGCALTLTARLHPGDWTLVAGRALGVVLATDVVTSVVRPIADGSFTMRASLPLSLCDVALVVAAFACWMPWRPLLVELTYFWGLAGSLQAVLTPDLREPFPQLPFFIYVAGHVGIVTTAIYLVVGLRCRPRPRSVPRIWLITLAYAAVVGVVDVATGGNYMFLRAKPSSASLLSVLGPWPWYIAGAAALALLLLVVLDAPFWPGRRVRPMSGSRRRVGREQYGAH
jgi:hypothetical integral membrane protein (TIGR02206 family)